jgi:mono/diheme cytochrome c family protein
MTRRALLLLGLVSLSAGAEPRSWDLQKGSGRARFRVEAPLDAIEGSSSGVSGSLTFDEGAWASGSGRIRIDLRSFTTGLSLRDEDLREPAFQVDRFPEAILTITRLERNAGRAVPGREGRPMRWGRLPARQEQAVRMPVTVSRPGRVDLKVSGRFDVALADDASTARPGSSSASARWPRCASRPVPLPCRAHGDRRGRARAGSTASPTAPRLELAVTAPGEPRPRSRTPATRLEYACQPGGTGSASSARRGGGAERLLRLPATDGATSGAGSSIHWATPPPTQLKESARRKSWRGFAETPSRPSTSPEEVHARPAGGTPPRSAPGAYLKHISPDAAAPLDYGPLIVARKTAIDRPTGGAARRGAVLTERFCGRCHGEGAMRPPLELGLYEPDYLVSRVRWIAPHDARQMPPFPLDRLRDAELRDIVTYLVGRDQDRIFRRKPRPAPAPRTAITEGISPLAGLQPTHERWPRRESP